MGSPLFTRPRPFVAQTLAGTWPDGFADDPSPEPPGEPPTLSADATAADERKTAIAQQPKPVEADTFPDLATLTLVAPDKLREQERVALRHLNRNGAMTVYQFHRTCALPKGMRTEALFDLHRLGYVALYRDDTAAGKGRHYVKALIPIEVWD
jgi:hypothetical protein